MLDNVDPVELDAVLGEVMVRSVAEARKLIDASRNACMGISTEDLERGVSSSSTRTKPE